MKIKHIAEERLIFDDGSVLASAHVQDCCEWHWLDFSVMNSYNVGTRNGREINIFEQEFDFSDGVSFKRVVDVGIILFDKEGNKYLICGYGCNNGYYGDDITLEYSDGKGNILFTYNVTECQEITD